MKTINVALFLAANIAITSTVFAADLLTCKDMEGTWRGSFDRLGAVTLYVSDTSWDPYLGNADIEVLQGPNGSNKVFKSKCIESGGKVTMDFSEGDPGAPIDINLKTQLIDKHKLNISVMTYKTWWATGSTSGSLTK